MEVFARREGGGRSVSLVNVSSLLQSAFAGGGERSLDAEWGCSQEPLKEKRIESQEERGTRSILTLQGRTNISRLVWGRERGEHEELAQKRAAAPGRNVTARKRGEGKKKKKDQFPIGSQAFLSRQVGDRVKTEKGK